MTGQPSTSAYWAEFLKEMDGDWWTEAEAVEKSVFTQSGVNKYINDMRNLGALEERERETEQVGPNPREYRYTIN